MGVIKLGGISVIVFALILFLFSLLIPSTVRISRAIDIEAPAKKVHDKISSLKSWGSWNELTGDSISVTLRSVTSGSVQTIWNNQRKTVESSFVFHESAGITVLQWYFDFRLKWYPWEKFASITLDKQFGPVMEHSLNNLKTEVENSP